MKKNGIIFLLILIIIPANIYCQHMDRDIDSLKTLKKAELVELALTSIDRTIDLSKFNVKVSASRKFMNAYFKLKADAIYIPRNTDALYDFHVNLLSGKVDYRIRSNYDKRMEKDNNPPSLDDLYISSETDQKNLSFVLNQLNAREEYSYINEDMAFVNVEEKADYFHVSIFYYGNEQYCDVQKGTGIITNEMSATEATIDIGEPNLDYEYEEIKD